MQLCTCKYYVIYTVPNLLILKLINYFAFREYRFKKQAIYSSRYFRDTIIDSIAWSLHFADIFYFKIKCLSYFRPLFNIICVSSFRIIRTISLFHF